RMPDAPLHVADLPAGVVLVPGAIELLGCFPELYDEVAREVLRLGFASFFTPEADKGGLVVAHDDPGVRAADEPTPLYNPSVRHFHFSMLYFQYNLISTRWKWRSQLLSAQIDELRWLAHTR